MKRSLPLIILLLSISGSGFSQTLKGKIVDSLKTPIPFSTIAILKNDSSLLKGVVNDDNGNFIIDSIPPGTYLLKITALSFQAKFINNLQTDSGTRDLSMVTLRSEGVHLNEISVSAIRNAIEFRNGNIIVNIENSPLAKGNTVYDLLSKLPGVSIDDNTIYLNGKAGVIVMIDERVQQLTNVQLLNILQNMNAETVEKIELFKNPPVKYDAVGTSGMINIKTKKTKLTGFSGSTYLSGSQGFYPRGMAGVSLNYKSEQLTIFSGIDGNYGYYRVTDRHEKKFTDDSTLTQFSSNNVLNDRDGALMFKLGMDWQATKKTLLGFKVDGGPAEYISDGYGTNTISNYNNLGYDHLYARVYNPSKGYISNYNINASHNFDSAGTNLSFIADYTLLHDRTSSDIANIFLGADNSEVLPPNIYRSDNKNQSDIFSGKLDFSKFVTEKTSFQIGAKGSFINTSNNYLFERKDNVSGNYFKDTSLTNNYTYSEQTYGAYVNYIGTFDKVNLQIGVRAENTNLIGRNTVNKFELKRSYYNLFPNISLEYNPSENHNLQLNLNRRINRPEYDDLNPFRYFRDQYSFLEGNPFLLPDYSNTIDFSHVYRKIFTNTFTFSRTDNVILSYTKQDDSTKVFTQSVKNMNYHNYFAYSLFIQHSLKSWWNISSNSLFFYQEYSGDITGLPFNTKTYSFNSSLTNIFTARRDLKIELIALYRGRNNFGIVVIQPRFMLSFALKKSFLKEKLNCSIGVNDIFYSYIARTGSKFENQNWTYYQAADTRRFTFSISYNFGRMKIEEREAISNEEEKERLNR